MFVAANVVMRVECLLVGGVNCGVIDLYFDCLLVVFVALLVVSVCLGAVNCASYQTKNRVRCV